VAQLGVLGFVGLCGVLRGDSGSGCPLWLQDLSGITALAGLVLALVAVTLVATVAFPLVAVPRSGCTTRTVWPAPATATPGARGRRR
jgi:hypothetical protein